MKRSLVILMAAAALLAATSPVRAADSEPARKKEGHLVHMVSFKFKDTATPADIAKVEEAFAALRKTIPQIASFEWGTNVSPEGLNKGFTHAFVLTFGSAADRDAYLIHPEHKKFGELLGPYLADVLVIDFQAQKAPKSGKDKKADKEPKAKKTSTP